MKVSIVIPAYNEARRIGETLEKIKKYIDKSKHEFEVIVSVDGAKDNTAEIASKYDYVIVEDYQPNRGKGFALRYGASKATGDWIYICDADLSTPIEELDSFLEYTDSYDCVIGSRAAKGAKEKSSKLRVLLGKAGNALINAMLNLDIEDTQCGFKLMNKKARDIFVTGEIDRWGFDFEMLYQIKDAGLRIKEKPVKWVAADYSTFTFGGYFTTLKELITVWWKYVGFSGKFWSNIWQRYGEVIRYLIVGSITNLISLFVFYALTTLYPISPVDAFGITFAGFQIAESIAYVLSIIYNFFSHTFWTFSKQKSNTGELGRYILMLIWNYVASIIIITFLINSLGLNELLAKLISIAFIVSWNFFILKFLIYRTHENGK